MCSKVGAQLTVRTWDAKGWTVFGAGKGASGGQLPKCRLSPISPVFLLPAPHASTHAPAQILDTRDELDHTHWFEHQPSSAQQQQQQQQQEQQGQQGQQPPWPGGCQPQRPPLPSNSLQLSRQQGSLGHNPPALFVDLVATLAAPKGVAITGWRPSQAGARAAEAEPDALRVLARVNDTFLTTTVLHVEYEGEELRVLRVRSACV